MITWPAIIKHDGEDELIYIKDKQQWQQDEEMLLYIFTDRDVLIDATGKVFSLPELQNNLDSDSYLAIANLENILELVQNHAQLSNQCCVAKIQTTTIQQAIELIATFDA